MKNSHSPAPRLLNGKTICLDIQFSQMTTEFRGDECCYELNVCITPKYGCWISTLDVTVFGDKAFMEVIKVKCGHEVGS